MGARKKTPPAAIAPLLGELTAAEIARRTGVCWRTASRWRKEAGHPPMRRGKRARTHEERHPALVEEIRQGETYAAELARRHGLTRERVGQIARDLQVELPRGPAGVGAFDHPLLGVMHDGDLADLAGVATNTVRAARIRRGLPALKHGPRTGLWTRQAKVLRALAVGAETYSELVDATGVERASLAACMARLKKKGAIVRSGPYLQPVFSLAPFDEETP